MRIWDQVPPSDLCDKHLLAQWREGLGLWSILTNGKSGYANHPETKRWVGNDMAAYGVLWATREAMLERGWNPKQMPAAPHVLVGKEMYGKNPEVGHLLSHVVRPPPWDDQLAALRAKGCGCKVPEVVA